VVLNILMSETEGESGWKERGCKAERGGGRGRKEKRKRGEAMNNS